MNRNEASEALAYPVDEAIADAARWIEGVTMYGGMRGWRAACAVLAAEVQLLRADAARLDWLADPDNIIGNVQLPTMCVMNNLHDMRAAIDEAMKLDPEVWAEVAAADAGETFGQEASDAR